MSIIPFYPADKSAVKLYAREKARLVRVLSLFPDLTTIEHFGSTAVSNLAGKGVIDILIVLKKFRNINKVIETLQQYGLHHQKTAGSARRYFLSDKPLSSPNVNFHYHIVQSDTPEHLDPLIFRDALNAHPDWAREYQTLKEKLSRVSKHPHQYRDGKASLIKEIIQRKK